MVTVLVQRELFSGPTIAHMKTSTNTRVTNVHILDEEFNFINKKLIKTLCLVCFQKKSKLKFRHGSDHKNL